MSGYNIYMGASASNLQRTASAGATQTSYTVGNLSSGTYYFGITAYNQSGTESAMSNIASKTVN